MKEPNTFEKVWLEFCNKMRQDKLRKSDFMDETQLFLYPLLCGRDAGQRREKFLSSPYEVFGNGTKWSVLLHCPDDDYRFDFLFLENGWKLSFIECVTLPISDISTLPYENFKALPPEKEIDIRSEKEISRLVFFYNQFKMLIGQQKALEMFYDGAGESLGARSWVPFYSDRLACIAYFAWLQNRIYGEQVEILKFDEESCRLRFRRHIWRKMYVTTGHMQKMIDYEEYVNLFESIWRNRALECGWTLQFIYQDEDTDLVFTKS